MPLDGHPYRDQILLLLRTSLVLFVFTVVVGILNGTDVVDFEQKVLLTHVHVGTLGWVTMNVFAATLWLFGSNEDHGWRSSAPRLLAPAAAVSIILYNVAFLTTRGWMRPALGGVAALVIVGYFVWACAQGRAVGMSTPRWGFLVALATSVTGGVLGVLWGVLLASNGDVKALPAGGEGAHPATMVVGFLIPVGMALIEWWIRPDGGSIPTERSGLVQMALLFVAGLSLMLGVLLDVVPLIMLNLPFEVAAVVVFVVRMRSWLRTTCWGGDAAPYFTASAIDIVINLGMLVYLLSKYAEDFEQTPDRLLLALDHVMFIGVMTNAIFGMTRAAGSARRSLVPWADRTVFWGMNAGLGLFWAGLVSDQALPKQLGTPLMGAAILLGVAVYFARTLPSTTEPSAAPVCQPGQG